MSKHAWRVERSRKPDGELGTGWTATQAGTGIGAWFRTWSDAWRFASDGADRHTMRGSVTVAPKPHPPVIKMPALEPEKRRGRRPKYDLSGVPAMRLQGMSYAEIAAEIGCTVALIYIRFPARESREIAS